MGLRDFVDRYVVALPPRKPSEGGAIDVSKIEVQSGPQVSELNVKVDEAPVKAISGIDVAFEKIFEAARIEAPAHKFTVEKVGEMLCHAKLASLAPEGKAAAVMVALEAQGVKIEEVIEEAIKKDKALDLFEKVQLENLKRTVAAKEEESKALALKIEANRKSCEQLENQVKSWVAKKNEKEIALFNIVSYFITKNPITVPELAIKPEASAAAAKAQTSSLKITDLTDSLDEPKA